MVDFLFQLLPHWTFLLEPVYALYLCALHEHEVECLHTLLVVFVELLL